MSFWCEDKVTLGGYGSGKLMKMLKMGTVKQGQTMHDNKLWAFGSLKKCYNVFESTI
jgi:hypothetical protein